MAGGLIGYGGFVSLDHCTVNCTIGNGKRQAYAMAAAIGTALRSISVTDCTIWATMYFVRVSNNRMNSAAVAVAPVTFGSATSPAPVLSGSQIKNTKCGAKVYYTSSYPAADGTDDYTQVPTSSTTLNSTNSIVRGNDYSTLSTDFTLEGNSNLTSAPK